MQIGPGARTVVETVLVVDDQECVRDVCRLMLEHSGYHVLTADCGAEAMRAWRNYRGEIDLLITDVVMPGMNGRELAQRLLRERPDLRLLYMSGCIDDPIVGHLVEQGVASLLAKPFSTDALTSRVRELLDSPRMKAGACPVSLR